MLVIRTVRTSFPGPFWFANLERHWVPGWCYTALPNTRARDTCVAENGKYLENINIIISLF